MSILAMATEKAQKVLYDNHEYEDGMVDQPILTPESVVHLDDL